MTPRDHLDLLIIELRNIQSYIEGINLSAERENALSGWRCDWEAARNSAQEEFNRLKNVIETTQWKLDQSNHTTDKKYQELHHQKFCFECERTQWFDSEGKCSSYKNRELGPFEMP